MEIRRARAEVDSDKMLKLTTVCPNIAKPDPVGKIVVGLLAFSFAGVLLAVILFFFSRYFLSAPVSIFVLLPVAFIITA